MFERWVTGSAFALLVGLAAASPARGAVIMSTFIGDQQAGVSGNDCTGEFGGQRGTICDVGFPLGEEISPIVAKFDTGGAWTLYDFASVDGSEFGGDFLSGDDNSGSWTYAPDADDPAIRYWVAKGGNGFNLFWSVADSATAPGGACDVADPYTVACLQEALSVTGGDYSAPGNAELSHISFYDTGGQGDDDGGAGDDDGAVPEPATLSLLGLGLAGLVYRVRRA